MFDDNFQPILEREAGRPQHEAEVLVAFGFYPLDKGMKDGLPFYEDTEFVAIKVPGEEKSFYLQPAKDTHRKSYPVAYKRFKDGITTPADGLPLSKWAPISRGEVLTYRALGVHTVETLAAMQDEHMGRFGNRGMEIRNLARAAIAQAKDGAAALKAQAELEKRELEIAALNAEVAATKRELAELASEVKKSRRKDAA